MAKSVKKSAPAARKKAPARSKKASVKKKTVPRAAPKKKATRPAAKKKKAAVKKKAVARSGSASNLKETAGQGKPAARRKTAGEVPKKKVAARTVAGKQSAATSKPAASRSTRPDGKSPTKKAAAKKPSAKKAPTKKAPARTAPVKAVASAAAAPPKKKKRSAPTIITKRVVAPRPKPVIKKGPPSKFVKPKVPYASLGDVPARGDRSEPETLPTEAELKKVKSGLSKKDLQAFRLLLLERRAEIIGDVAGLEAARSGNAGDLSHVPLHMADVGSDNYEQEFTLGLMESERKTVVEIDEALQRIVQGTYGVCAISAQPISRPRLEAKPWAKYSIEVARERERRGR